MNDDHRPTEPAGENTDSSERKGFAGIARLLNELHPDRRRPISRQLVHKWYLHRSYNRFPEPAAMAGGGTGRPVFDITEVENWYISYRRYHGETLPERTAAPISTTDSRSMTAREEGSIAA